MNYLKKNPELVGLLKGIRFVAKDYAIASILHSILYIIYMAMVGQSVLDGALIRPNAVQFVNFGTSLMFLFVTMSVAGNIIWNIKFTDTIACVRRCLHAILLTLFTIISLPAFNQLMAPMLTMVAIILIIVIPKSFDFLYETEKVRLEPMSHVVAVDVQTESNIDVDHVQTVLEAKFGEAEPVSPEELADIADKAEQESQGDVNE
jgi:hypothetical protein